MAHDPFADTRGTPDPGAAHGSRAHDIEPDWFEFDELKKSSSRAQAELSAALGAALAEVEAARRDVEPEVSAPAPAPVASAPEREPEPVIPQRAPARARPDETSARSAAPRSVLALLALAVAANLVIAGVAWRTLASVDALAGDLGRELRAARPTAGPASAAIDLGAQAATNAVPEAARSLDLAQRMIAEREFAQARRTLCELLAVVDGFDDPARREIEARARFLIADAWRVEAESAAGRGGGG